MAEEEEWLLAAEAVRLLKQVFNSEHAAKIAICKRAHSGLVRASAQRLVIDDKTRDNVEVPKEFWWAEGGDTLKQDWAIGDFNTWIGLDKVSGNPHLSAGKIQIKAFAVKFVQRYPRGSRRQMLQLTQSVAEGIKVLQVAAQHFRQDRTTQRTQADLSGATGNVRRRQRFEDVRAAPGLHRGNEGSHHAAPGLCRGNEGPHHTAPNPCRGNKGNQGFQD